VTRGFTLLELLMVLLVVAILAAGLSMPLAAQVQVRRYDETRRALDEAREALLGFAAANGRLPCPASAASRGEESFAPGGDAVNGRCSNAYDGYLPAAALGLGPLDDEGYLRDGWGTKAHRVRYAVFGGGAAVNGITDPLTRANGMQMATLPGLGAASHLLLICAAGAPVGGASCGPATNQLTRRAAFLLLSLGPDATTVPAPGSDAARNVDGDAVFVSHEPSAAPGGDFDDIVAWVPVHVLASRLMAAGRLP
jgi:prepilin-type N-terminal cleavage/methylation domain-containing protein